MKCKARDPSGQSRPEPPSLLPPYVPHFKFVTCSHGMQAAPNVFNEVTIITCLGSISLFMAFVIFAWRRGLLSWS